jgi:hypothetical protein
VRAGAVLALVALLVLLVAERDTLFGWLADDQPVWTAVAAFVVPAVIIAAYMATGTRGIARVPIDALVGWLIPILLAPFLFLFAVGVLATRPLAALVGRVPDAASEAAEATSRTP